MGLIIVTEFLSLDNVFEDPGGAENFRYGGWTFKFDTGDDGKKFKFDELMGAEAALLGRVTYEGFAKAWPSMQGEFADKMNNMPKYVVTNNPDYIGDWNSSHTISGDVISQIKNLKRKTSGSILVSGSAKLANFLLANGLVDRLNVMVFPVILGEGRKFFAANNGPLTLSLESSVPVGKDGVIIGIYKKSEKIDFERGPD